MTNNVLDGCSDTCGWVAAIFSAIAYGSFGVPIKETRKYPVHPLVMQSYKTAVVFLASWLVVFLDVTPAFTPWGLVSGTLWVVGGTGGIYAIRMAGIAVAVGTWASVMIVVNFFWGILVFEEPVADIWDTIAAFLFLIFGLVGMSKYSSAGKKKPTPTTTTQQQQQQQQQQQPLPLTTPSTTSSSLSSTKRSPPPPPLAPSEHCHLLQEKEQQAAAAPSASSSTDATVTVCGVTASKRVWGILGAVWNGVMTGSSLAPLHYAKKAGFGGANYMISVATGSLVANVALWIIMFLAIAANQYKSSSSRSSQGNNSVWLIVRQACHCMPNWYLRQLWFPGFMAGLLLAIGMFLSLLAITYLGQGIGNSVVQAKILVSGLWGIFYYREITGTRTISYWFLSAFMSILGILWLSHERIAAKVASNQDAAAAVSAAANDTT